MIRWPEDWTRLLRHPLAALLPTTALVTGLLAILAGVHVTAVMPAQERLSQLQREWREARLRLLQHAEAKRALQDLEEVLKMIPGKRDFVPLALGITEEATRHHVSLPALSYQMLPTSGDLATKAVFDGSATGRYEDIRRFIRQLELADELLFIEDLDVVRTGVGRNGHVTFRMQIATYLRNEPDNKKPTS